MECQTEDSYERRREQVRRAQKTHRERKAAYVKALEDEVAELRKQNALLRNSIDRYQEILAKNGIPDSTSAGEAQASSGGLTTISFVGDAGKRGIQAHFPQATGESQSTPSVREGGTPAEAYEAGPSSLEYLTSNITMAAHPPGLGTQEGINFVLALEQPCINHHKTDQHSGFRVDGETGVTGHQAMLSSPIMARAPSRSPSPLPTGYPAAHAEWTVPAAELEALLRFSRQLGLKDTEITPVQAWQMVTQHAKFANLTSERLERLKRIVLPMVRCYGFGAVIDRVHFEQALGVVFSAVGQV